MMIKCLLKRHRYPPEGMDDAVQTVMTQCELWTDNNDIMEQMKATEGVTAELKCTCQMEWVQRYNNIHNRAEEIDLHVMVYS